MNEEIARRQSRINLKYKEEGLTDEVLDAQVELNKMKHEQNISDETNKTYKGFVQ